MCLYLQLDFGIPHDSIFHLINAQVCERSLGNTLNGPSMPQVQNFVRAEMLPSGYLIRPCEGGGSIVHIVDHMNLEVNVSSIMSENVSFFSSYVCHVTVYVSLILLPGMECARSVASTV